MIESATIYTKAEARRAVPRGYHTMLTVMGTDGHTVRVAFADVTHMLALGYAFTAFTDHDDRTTYFEVETDVQNDTYYDDSTGGFPACAS